MALQFLINDTIHIDSFSNLMSSEETSMAKSLVWFLQCKKKEEREPECSTLVDNEDAELIHHLTLSEKYLHTSLVDHPFGC